MADDEQPERRGRRPTIADILQIVGGATPHFALQLRDRVARLIAPLPADDPVRLYGVRQCALLEELALRDEFRGEPPRPDLPPLPSLVLDGPVGTPASPG
jgi:hypothetical protein